MLKNAYPLMEIYRSEREPELGAFLLSDAGKVGKRRSILSTLPLYTISDGLLERILARHGIVAAQKERIKKHAAAQKRRVERILISETIEDEIPTFQPGEFKEGPPVLELSEIFCDTDISYNEEEYAAHLRATKAFAEQNPNYTVKLSISHAFHNLQVLIHEGRWAMISKGKAPSIHFVVRHPKLRGAIESFVPPITERK